MNATVAHQLDADEVVAAAAFAAEASCYWRGIADQADLEYSWHQLEGEADRAQCHAAGAAWARLLGLPTSAGPLFEVLAYSSRRDFRARAAAAIARIARRQAGKAAA